MELPTATEIAKAKEEQLREMVNWLRHEAIRQNTERRRLEKKMINEQNIKETYDMLEDSRLRELAKSSKLSRKELINVITCAAGALEQELSC
ncbi:MAG: hypothetical protein ACLFPF_07210 [Halanaerobiales bacterium]